MSTKTKKKSKLRYVRRFLRVLAGVLIFFIALVLFIKSPWGQNIIIDKLTNYVSNKTNTTVNIDKAYLTFGGNLKVEGLFLDDKKGDTLIYSKSLEANLPIWGIINGNKIGVDALEWKGLRATISRKDTIESFNFQFLVDAFATQNPNPQPIDTTTTSPEIYFRDLDLEDIDFVFNDDVLGINSRYKIEKLEGSFNKTDIENIIFDAGNLYVDGAKITYVQKPSQIVSEEPAPLPKLMAGDLELKNTQFYYEDTQNKIITDFKLKDFKTNDAKVNLKDSIFSFDEIALKNSTGLVKTSSTQSNATSTYTAEFSWPNFKISANTIDFENNSFEYIVNNKSVRQNVFDPEAIAVNELFLKASNISYENKKANIQLEDLRFKESSGLQSRQLAFKAEFTDNNLVVNDFIIRTKQNTIAGNLSTRYNGVSQFINSPENVNVSASLNTINVQLAELFQFQPNLKQNPSLLALSKKPITGKLYANGNLADISIYQSTVNWGKQTQINLDGSVQNATNVDLLAVNFTDLKAKTVRSDINKFINTDSLSVNLPEEIILTGDVKGKINDINADLLLNSSQGTIAVKGNFKNDTILDFDTEISINNYKLDELLGNNQYGEVSLDIKTKGKGKTLNDLDATLNATINKFSLNDYAIKDLKLQGDIKNGVGKVTSNYKDENLNIELDGNIDLDTVNTILTANIDVVGADLGGLGIMQRNIKTGMDISLGFKGNAKKYNVNADIKNGVVVYDNRTYLLGGITADAFVDTDTTSFSLNNKMAALNLESNTDPNTFSKTIRKHVLSYFYKDEQIDTAQKPINLKFRGKLMQTPLLKKVFLVNLEDIDTVDIAVNFNQKEKKLDARITAPHIMYYGNEIDSLLFDMQTTKDDFNFKLAFKDIKANPLQIPRTIISGQQKDNELSLNFKAIHNEELMMNVNTKVIGDRELLQLSVNPDSLILNKHIWKIPKNNKIELVDNKRLQFTDFRITKGNQSIEITDNITGVEKEHVAISYDNFQIQEFFNFLNPEQRLATGILGGNFILEDPFVDTGIISNLTVSNLKVLKTDFGKLTLKGESLGNGKYDFNVNLKEGDVDLDLIGDYIVQNTDASLDLDLDINRVDMKVFNTLSLGEIKNSTGSFSGKFKVQGSPASPEYDGSLKFSDASFNISKLNTQFTLKNESLRVNNEGLFMDNFTILDAKQNTLVLSGNIGTESFLNPTFNVQLKAKNFRLLNATQEDNPNLFGTAIFSADAKLTGDLQIPKLSSSVTVSPETNVTYVLPPTYATIESRDDVVQFVNRENPDAILTQTEEKTAIIKGFDIGAKIKVNRKAVVNLILNENTGDNFRVSGEGDFIFNMRPNGNVSLTGTYEIAGGHYELNLYDLVQRKFLLNPGGRIQWSGDLFNAKLDLSAIYNISTSASSLMASQVSNEDPSVRNRFKQVLPFNVYLNIDGELTEPKISFNLDMPEDAQGAIGGQVYGRVQQLNQQEEELNKQVFSLLVLNRFYPSGSDGSRGGVANIARENFNTAVSSQLNAFSDRILGNSGFDLNFDLNSYTDFQGTTATDRTQLGVTAEQRLFSDRLTVKVGSDIDIQGSNPTGQQTPLIGNVSLEYKLSEDGRYILRGFRRNEFENVVDGQTIVSGIALIFTLEFNEFSEMWDALFKKQQEENDEEDENQDKKEASKNKNATIEETKKQENKN